MILVSSGDHQDRDDDYEDCDVAPILVSSCDDDYTIELWWWSSRVNVDFSFDLFIAAQMQC